MGALKSEKKTSKNREGREEKSVKLKNVSDRSLRQNDADIFSVCFPVKPTVHIFYDFATKSGKIFEIFRVNFIKKTKKVIFDIA